MNEEQRALYERASEDIQVSKDEAAQGRYRIAVSRSYYAMFYLAKAMLLQLDLRSNKHSGVISLFGKTFAKTGLVPVEFHDYLIKAEKDRIAADYRVTDPPVTEEAATMRITQAEEFLALAAEHLGPLPDGDDHDDSA